MTREVVIDASVALKWFVNEPGAHQAQLLFAADIRRIAPDLALAEVANGLRRKERTNVLAASAVDLAVAGLARMFHLLEPSSPHVGEAAKLSRQLDHSVYDCLYLVIARHLSATLLTADARLVAKLGGTPLSAQVVALSDWR
jgi:predicted nucleic acid-binding protein